MSSLRGRFNPALGVRDPWDLRGFGAAVSEPAAGPRKEYVFDDSTTAVQCLSMSDYDWSYPNEPDLSEFGILVRVVPRCVVCHIAHCIIIPLNVKSFLPDYNRH